jgi:hypothetical protein
LWALAFLTSLEWLFLDDLELDLDLDLTPGVDDLDEFFESLDLTPGVELLDEFLESLDLTATDEL